MSRRWLAGILTAVVCVAFVLPVFPQNSTEISETMKPSVALLLLEERPTYSGSAFVIHPDGLLVTALHGIDETRHVFVLFSNGQREEADVIGVDTDNDLALLHVSKTGLVPLRLGNSDSLKTGEEIAIASYQSPSHDLVITRGSVGALPAHAGLIPIETSTDLGGGGGPVLNMNGEVIGIAVSRLNPSSQSEISLSPISSASSLLVTFQSKPNRPPLPLPLTEVKSLTIDYTSGGIGSGGSRQQLGISCIEPPSHADALSTVNGELVEVDTRLMGVVTWLSVRSGAVSESPASFASLRHAAHLTSVPGPSSLSVYTSNLALMPSRVCLNYSAWVLAHPLAMIFMIGFTFHVRYTVDYRVLPNG